jgi:hypothetical protein
MDHDPAEDAPAEDTQRLPPVDGALASSAPPPEPPAPSILPPVPTDVAPWAKEPARAEIPPPSLPPVPDPAPLYAAPDGNPPPWGSDAAAGSSAEGGTMPLPEGLLPPPPPPPLPYDAPAPTQQFGAPPAYTLPPAYGALPAPPPAASWYNPPPASPYGGYYGDVPAVPSTSGLAIGAMVCGLLGVPFSCLFFVVGLVLDLVALGLVWQYNKQRRLNPLAPVNPQDATFIRVGRVAALIGLVLAGLYLALFCGLIFISLASSSTSTP